MHSFYICYLMRIIRLTPKTPRMKIDYNNLYTHFILTTLLRQPMITEIHRNRIEKYITGVVNGRQSKLYAIYSNPDHTHILVSRSPSISELDLVSSICSSSESFINDHQLSVVPFAWQKSASAFSVSKRDVNRVCRYILNQASHHRIVSFDEEFKGIQRHYQTSLFKR
jgi:putative transposase